MIMDRIGVPVMFEPKNPAVAVCEISPATQILCAAGLFCIARVYAV